jgi:hypothetical protein
VENHDQFLALPFLKAHCMHPALLAAFVLNSLPVYLYPQTALPDVSWPTHATIVVPRGDVPRGEELVLLENGRPISAQFEVASRWPDGSAKWIHAHGAFRYAAGKPATYAFAHPKTLPAEIPKSPLTVRDTPDGIDIDTGVVKLRIPRPFVGIALLEQNGKPIVSGEGGPHVVDGEGTLWHARHDRDAKIEIEEQGPARITIKASGYYQTPTPRADAFCRFTTRITAFADSALVKIDHATTFSDDMKKHAVAELAFKFSLPGATSFVSSTHKGTFSDKLQAAYLAQLTDDRVYRIAQFGPDAERDIRHQGDFERSSGWFCEQVGDANLALLAKDFWQKCPKEVKLGRDELVYYAWPKHGDLAPSDPSATLLHNLYKFKCFQSGKLLSSTLPDDYYQALVEQEDTTECKPEFARANNLHGVSLRNEFALVVVPSQHQAAPTEYLEKFQQLYLQNPTARVSPNAVATSGALGPVAAAGRDFAAVEQTVVDGLLGYLGSIPRYGDYGWTIYGNAHHEEFMDYSVDGRRVGRPSIHRVWNNCHYQHVSTAWQVWGLNGDARTLQLARLCTDNYASIGQVRFDKQWAESDPADPKRRPSVKFHHPGAFYHCKGLVPWGGRDYGMETLDVDAGLTGHWPDPTALLYAWLFDADRWSKDGYELWLAEVKFPNSGTRREINHTFVQAINAYDYAPDDKTLECINGMLHGTGSNFGLLGLPILQQQPGPIWNPTWLSRAYEMFPDDQELRDFIVKSADEINISDSGIFTIALSVTAWEITRDTKYLLRHAGTIQRMRNKLFQDPTGRWQNYSQAPGPPGDGFFALQWHRYAKALRDSGIGLPKAPTEFGHYLSATTRYDNAEDIAARGTRVLILGPSDAKESPRTLTIDASPVLVGDLPVSSMMFLNPAGQPLWKEPKTNFGPPQSVRVHRPTSWHVWRQVHPGPVTAGLHTLVWGSHAIGIHQGLAGGLPECQILRNVKTPDWTEPITYVCRLTQGWLVPTSNAQTTLKCTAYGRLAGTHISVKPQQGKSIDRWLVSGESIEIPLSPEEGPWYLNIFGDGESSTRVEVHSTIGMPLLYGANLEHVQQIKQVILPRS